MSVQRSVRFPEDVAAKMAELAEQADRDFSYMVVRACEAYYLGKTKAGFPSVPSGVVQESVPVAGVPLRRDSDVKREQRQEARASRPAHSPTCKCALCKPPR